MALGSVKQLEYEASVALGEGKQVKYKVSAPLGIGSAALGGRKHVKHEVWAAPCDRTI